MVTYNTAVSDDNDTEFFIPIPFKACVGIGYSMYFTGISMFCWFKKQIRPQLSGQIQGRKKV